MQHETVDTASQHLAPPYAQGRRSWSRWTCWFFLMMSMAPPSAGALELEEQTTTEKPMEVFDLDSAVLMCPVASVLMSTTEAPEYGDDEETAVADTE